MEIKTVKFLTGPADNENRRISTMVSRNRKSLTLGLILAQLMAPVSIVTPVAQADTTTPATGSASYSPFNFTGTPVSFQVAQAQSMSNLYGSCFTMGTNDQTTTLVNSITQLTTGKPVAGKADASGCPVIKGNCSMAVSSSTPQCPLDRDDKAINALFDSAFSQAKSANCCVKSKEGQLAQAGKELSCIDQQSDLLAQQIKSLQTDLQSKFQQAQKDLSQIDTVVGDRVNQMEFIQNKLGGDKTNGTRGLLALQADMQKVITGELPAKIKTFEDTITAYNQQQTIFQQRVANQKMALAKQCFTSADSRYQCSVNSTSTCSFAELMEAKYYELMRSVNGQIQRNNKSNQAQAQSKKAALDALFQTIFANMSSDTKLVATTQQDMQNQQQQAGDIYQIKTPQDLQTLYGAQLAAFDIPGLDIQQLFLNKFEQCYEQAQSTVTSAQGDPTSQYSLSVAFMQKQQKDIRDGFIQYYKGYADMYAQFWSTMGQTAPLDTSKCEASSTPIAGMLQCAKDLQTNLEGAYTGKTANSAVTIQVKGNSTNPVTQFNFTCNGVNGCVTVMQNLTTNLKSETQKLDQTKKSYIQQANQTLDQFKTQMQNVLSTQSQALTARLKSLKGVLSQAGVNDPLTIQTIQGKPLTKSKTKDSAGNEYDGLYEMPDDLLAAIGGNLSPPLVDPNGGTFDNARSAIAQAVQNDEQKDNDSARMMAELVNLKQSCLTKYRDESGKRSVAYIDNYSRQCLPDACVNHPKDLSSFINTVSSAANGTSTDVFDDVDSRLKGLADQCKKMQTSLGQASDELSSACGLLARNCKASEAVDVVSKCPNPDSLTFLPDSKDPQSTNCTTAITKVSDSFYKGQNAKNDTGTTTIANCNGLSDSATKYLKRARGDDSSDSDNGEAD